MLTSLQLKNFKSFADTTVELSPLTLLLGANASGKSNFLDAIRFLHGLGLDLPLSDIFRGRLEGGREVWPGLRGGTKETGRSGSKSFTLQSRWTVAREELVHTISCQIEPEPLVEHESLEAKGLGGFLFDTNVSGIKGLEGFTSGGPMKATPKKGRSMRTASSERHPARRSLLGQIEHQRGRGESIHLPDVVALCSALQTAMRSTFSLDVEPARMYGYVARQCDQLSASGDNLSAVVRSLSQDPDRKAEVLGWLKALSATEITDIGFVETSLGDVMMTVIEQDGTQVSTRSLAHGTLRILAKIIAMLSANEGSLLLIEDLESGLHPAQVSFLVEILGIATRPGASQIVATTHSPTLLKAMPQETIGQAVVFGRREGTVGTVASQLRNLPKFEEMLKGGIEQLFNSRL